MFLALRDLRFARGRFALVGLVVGLLAVLGVVLSGLATGLASDGVSGIKAIPATDLAFERTATDSLFSRSTVDLATVEEFQAAPGVQDAAPYGNALAHATVTEGSDVGNELDLALFGVQPGSFIAPEPATGQPLGAADGILVSPKLLDEGVAVGDVLEVDRVGATMRVAGTTGEASFGHVGVAYLPLPLWQRISYGLPGTPPSEAFRTATAVALDLTGDADRTALAAATGTQVVPLPDSFAASPGYTAETATMALIRWFLYIISALVVGAFFTVWTVQRRPEIALVKALGASTGYVLRDALAQVVVVLVSATVAGTAVGLLLGGLVGDEVPFDLEPGPVLVSGLLIVGLGTLGAAAAVRRVTKVDPLISLGGAR